jgi:hypothetical protein
MFERSNSMAHQKFIGMNGKGGEIVGVKPNKTAKSQFTQIPKKPQLALVQHPMWLIIDEDTECEERVPPWGAPNLQSYSERVFRNLEVLENNPNIKINYDFSAVELEDLFERYPELAKKIRYFVQRGQLGFVNGTYSQPHAHTLSLEANIRQLQTGMAVIRELTGYQVQTHAMQEPDYSDQMVQLLKAVGIRYTTRGEFLNGLVTQLDKKTPPPYFYKWVGLDSTSLPLLATYPHFRIETYPEKPHTQKNADSFIIHYPDMEEFKLEENYDYVLLDEGLRKKLKSHPAKTEARIYIPWSYVEGARAEELMRLNTAAEISLIQSETMEAISTLWPPKTESRPADLWKLWMKAQHHDAYWLGAPVLRKKSCEWLKQIIQRTETIMQNRMEELLPKKKGAQDSKGILLFSVYPKAYQNVVFAPWKGPVPRVLKTLDGKSLPVQIHKKINNHQTEIMFPVATDGIELLTLSGSQMNEVPKLDSAPLQEGWQYQNSFYKASFGQDGTVSQIELPQGIKLIEERVYLSSKNRVSPGGDLSALIKDQNVLAKFETYHSSIRKGPVADILEFEGNLGPVEIIRTIYLFHNLPWMETTIQCKFNNLELGKFHEDSYKLCYWWPSWNRRELVQGIPGGAIVPDLPEVCMHPVNWLDQGSIAIANWGTLKTFRRETRVGMVLAWGTNDDEFGNRADAYRWRKKMDLRLNGTHLFRFAIYPHAEDWLQANIPDWAMMLHRPPVTYPCALPENLNTLNKEFISMKSSSLIPTAVLPDKKGMRIRFFESMGQEPTVEFTNENLPVKVAYTDMAGNPVKKIKPWFIGEAQISAK